VETEHDLLPEGGYAKLVQAIFDETNPKVKFNEKVVKIDYE
jgi:UDP-galactopyranose mutase